MNRKLNRSYKARQRSQRRIWNMRKRREEYLVVDKDKLVFPCFVIHSDNVELIDGILWLDDQVLDDKNMSGHTLGIRRIQSPICLLYTSPSPRDS